MVIFLTDGHLKFTSPDGKTEEAQAKAGQIMWGEQVKHAGENLGDQPFEAVVVELKSQVSKDHKRARK